MCAVGVPQRRLHRRYLRPLVGADDLGHGRATDRLPGTAWGDMVARQAKERCRCPVSGRSRWVIVAVLADERNTYWCAQGSRRGGQDHWSPRESQPLRYSTRAEAEHAIATFWLLVSGQPLRGRFGLGRTRLRHIRSCRGQCALAVDLRAVQLLCRRAYGSVPHVRR